MSTSRFRITMKGVEVLEVHVRDREGGRMPTSLVSLREALIPALTGDTIDIALAMSGRDSNFKALLKAFLEGPSFRQYAMTKGAMQMLLAAIVQLALFIGIVPHFRAHAAHEALAEQQLLIETHGRAALLFDFDAETTERVLSTLRVDEARVIDMTGYESMRAKLALLQAENERHQQAAEAKRETAAAERIQQRLRKKSDQRKLHEALATAKDAAASAADAQSTAADANEKADHLQEQQTAKAHEVRACACSATSQPYPAHAACQALTSPRVTQIDKRFAGMSTAFKKADNETNARLAVLEPQLEQMLAQLTHAPLPDTADHRTSRW